MTAEPSQLLPKPGDIIDGKYTLEGLLGKGGMGAVYRARHIKLGHRVAIKVMLADATNREAAQRFINEGSAASNIQNDHVVRVYDVDEENGYAFMVLELLEGEDLGQILDRLGRLPYHTAVAYVMQALQGVKEAHARGIVHRDLKPSNLFLATRPNGSAIVKVLDFGISKTNSGLLGQAPGVVTSTKAMLGSPLYMSPEQLRSSKNVDARADIWAIGIILFQLITNRLAFEGDNLGELFAAILETESPPLRSLVPTVPEGLEAVVTRCLQRRPEHRFQTVAELEQQLAPFAIAMTATGTPYSAPLPGPSMATRAMPTAFTGTPSSILNAPGTSPALSQPQPNAMHSPPLGMTPQGGVGGYAGRAPMARGTVPLGAVTPQPHASQGQTGNTWQNTGPAAKNNRPAIVIGVLAIIIVIGAGLVAGLTLWAKHSRTVATDGMASASATATQVSTVTSVAAPSATTAGVATSEPTAAMTSMVATASASASASAAPTATQVAGTGAQRHPPPPTVKVEPPKPEPPKPPPVATHPSGTSGSGGVPLQGNR